jgi:hypothetical protein
VKPTINDTDITIARATHLYGELRFERATQDRRTYYRMLRNDRGTGSLTSAKVARETIAYWRSKGWAE